MFGVVVLGAIATLFLNSERPQSIVQGCSSDANRPCFEKETASNLQAAVSGGVKKEKLDTATGKKEFSVCVKNKSNRQGEEKENTKLCNAEIVHYCEDVLSTDNGNSNAKNEYKRIKEYDGKCETEPVSTPPPSTISYTITVTQAPNGTISPGTTSVTSGGNQIFTLTAAPGYQVAGVILDGVDQGGNMLAQQTYTFSGVTSAYSITARFSPVMPYYTITVTQAPNGTIAPGTASIYSGNSQTYNIFPATGYKVVDVIVDGVSQGALTTYTFVSVASPHSITATFSPMPVAQSCVLTVSIAPTTPAAQNISPGQSGVTLVKFNATSNCDGTLSSFATSLLPSPNGYKNISTLRLYDDVSGVQFGTTQSVTTAGMNFPSVNTPLTANQTLVLRVVGDVSPSAVIGSTVYGTFGGSSGVTGLGGVIGNNASGNLISGNTMTIR